MHKIIGYYTSWSAAELHYVPADIPGDKLTHINYAFFLISDEGECVLGDGRGAGNGTFPDDDRALKGHPSQMAQLKAAYPHLKTLMSVGGWTGSVGFSDAALTAESRERFARSCVEQMACYQFDGVDIDWEYPGGGGVAEGRPEDKVNFTRLLVELRRQLDVLGAADDRHYLLTIAAPAPPAMCHHIELDRIHAHLDWINLMTYDFVGAWSEQTGFHAVLYDTGAGVLNGDAVVRAYREAGIPAEKIVLGVPFYGRGWTGVPGENHGLGQPFSDVPDDDGYMPYHNIKAHYLGNAQRFWHDTAQAPWLYQADIQTMIAYDDPDTLRVKTTYVKDHGLGGVMFWELSLDDKAHTLLNTMYEQLKD